MPAKTAKKSAPDYGEFTAHPAADVFPLMKQDDLQRLADDIREHGQLDDIEVLTDTRQIIDGRNRFLACRLAGVEPHIVEVTADAMPFGIYEYVVSKNLLRRQLTAVQRQAVVKKLREGGQSIRTIAETTGIPRATVARDVKELAQSGQLDQPERIQGKDGRERPASMPKADSADDDEITDAEIAGEPAGCPVIPWTKAFKDLRALLANYTRDVPADEAGNLAAILRAEADKLDKKASVAGESEPSAGEPTTKEINDWARTKGYKVSAGRASKELRAEYMEAHRESES